MPQISAMGIIGLLVAVKMLWSRQEVTTAMANQRCFNCSHCCQFAFADLTAFDFAFDVFCACEQGTSHCKMLWLLAAVTQNFGSYCTSVV